MRFVLLDQSTHNLPQRNIERVSLSLSFEYLFKTLDCQVTVTQMYNIDHAYRTTV